MISMVLLLVGMSMMIVPGITISSTTSSGTSTSGNTILASRSTPSDQPTARRSLTIVAIAAKSPTALTVKSAQR